MERDLLALRDGAVEGIHIVIDLLTGGFAAVEHMGLLLQLMPLMGTGKPLQLAQQFHGFALGDETGGLHRIGQQLQLGKFKLTLAQIIDIFPPTMLAHDVRAIQAQGLDIAVQALAVADLYAPVLQGRHQLVQGQGMLFIGLLSQDVQQMQGFQLLVVSLCHYCPSPSKASCCSYSSNRRSSSASCWLYNSFRRV